ncbi:hypothetical protein [Endozoicomonas arenosclerae]|uniref:hypothetical protein n=1 Tax=Endozoicomonas arenosclerae TaxID=1633495 RepID=UPI000783FE4A|nr:hypothetical protein [Endozoicomonas arenosclerae]
MSNIPIRPEDILSDKQDYKIIKGVKVRKGTIAAAIHNISLLDSVSPEQRDIIIEVIRESATALVALDVHRYFACRNEEVEAILSQAAEDLDKSDREQGSK